MYYLQVMTALGKIWHPEHFQCAHCNVELGTQNFFERDGLPYCEKDYHQLFSPMCAACGGPILDVSESFESTIFEPHWNPRTNLFNRASVQGSMEII